MTTYLYCYANGVAKFGRRIPKGALPIDHRTDRQLEAEAKRLKKAKAAWSKDPSKKYPAARWKDSMTARLRLSYDGKTMLVPGIPEASDQTEALSALMKFKKWAVTK